MVVAQEKKKIGLALHPEFVEELGRLADGFKSGGMKATCVEAAILMFTRASDGDRVEHINAIRAAELTDSVGDLLKPTSKRIAASRGPGKRA